MINNAEECQVECISRRRNLLEDENIFQRLQDELVEEIFCRLPCSKNVIRCKCVCKQWAALISNPSFVRRFIASKVPCRMQLGEKRTGRRCNIHYEDDFDMDKGEKSFVVVTHNMYRVRWKELILHLKDPLSNLHSFSFSRLPCLVDEKSTAVAQGACNGLLLYCRHEHERYDYYICNFQTRQWLSLPPCQFYHGTDAIAGFTCDPHYSYESGNFGCNVMLNASYRFCVVVVQNTTKASSQYSAHLLSSNRSTRQWTKIVLSLPRPCDPLCTRSFVFAGKVHFRSPQGIIVFDPYKDPEDLNGTVDCRVVDWPSGLSFGTACPGLRQGNLQLSSFDNYGVYWSWVLKDYERGEWSLQHKIAKYEWVPREPISSRHREDRLWPGCHLCQHPTKPNLFYVLGVGSTHISLCNATEKTVEVASGKARISLRMHPCFYSFPSLLPVWPTPLPKLG